MKTDNLTYIGKILNDGHLSIDENIKTNLGLKEGDKLEITLKKLDNESDIASEATLSAQAKEYIDYLVGSGIKGKALKKVIKEIRAIDNKYQTMSRSEFIKEALTIAESRAKAWSQKQQPDIERLSEDELLATINRLRDSD